jgi:hypothetical protein
MRRRELEKQFIYCITDWLFSQVPFPYLFKKKNGECMRDGYETPLQGHSGKREKGWQNMPTRRRDAPGTALQMERDG